MTVLLLADHDNKALSANVAKAMTAAKALGQGVHVLVAGAGCKGVAEAAAKLDGAAEVLLADAPQLSHQLAEFHEPCTLRPVCDCRHFLTWSDKKSYASREQFPSFWPFSRWHPTCSR